MFFYIYFNVCFFHQHALTILISDTIDHDVSGPTELQAGHLDTK